jgi:PASTA domain
VICQYAIQHNPAMPAPVPRIVLNAAAADGLAAIIDNLPRVNADEQPRCPGESARYAQLIRFGYAAKTVESAWITYCPAQVIAAGRKLVPDLPLVDALNSYAAGVEGNTGPRVPDLLGLSLASAEAAAKRHGLAVRLTGTTTDARVPFGTVIFQALVPGARSRLHNGPVVSVVVATRPAPACTAAQLALTYRGVIATRGSDYGAIAIRDVGRAPCELKGVIRITGIDRQDHAVTLAARSLPGSVTLSPNAFPVPEVVPNARIIPPPPADLDGAIWLSASYGGAPCRPNWMAPAAWRVILPGGLTFTVANADAVGAVQLVPSGGFVTCASPLVDASFLYFGQPLH